MCILNPHKLRVLFLHCVLYNVRQNAELHIHCALSQITEESPKGVWVCSTDMVLQVPKDTGAISQ